MPPFFAVGWGEPVVLRTFLKVTLFVLCVVGLATLLGAFQLHLAQNAAKTTPQSLSLADLIAHGPGDNAYVELTDVHFGKPVVEKGASGWKNVWLPLYTAEPPADKPKTPEAVLRVSGLADQAALHQFLQRPSVTALVASRMPSPSPWSASLSPAAVRANPNFIEATLLVEPEVTLAGWSWGPEDAFKGTTLIVAWSLGGFLLLVGTAGLLLMGRSRPTMATVPEVIEVPAGPKVNLEQERAISSHEFASGSYYWRSGVLGVLLLGVVALGSALVVAGFMLFADKPTTGYMVSAVGGLMAIMAVAAWYQFGKVKSQGVAEIHICPGGIRWRRTSGGPLQTTPWSELAGVHRTRYTVYQGLMTQEKDEVTIRLRTEEKIVLSRFNLTDYPVFAQLIVEGHQQGAVFSMNQNLAGFLPVTSLSRR